MQIDTISNTNFVGKIKISNNISKPQRDYIEKILDYSFEKTTLRQRIKKASYDVEVFSLDSKKTIHPKVHFYSKFSKIKECLWDYDSYGSTSKALRIDLSEEEGAKFLKDFLDKFDKYKKNTRYSYNTLGEKIIARLKKFFGMKF